MKYRRFTVNIPIFDADGDFLEYGYRTVMARDSDEAIRAAVKKFNVKADDVRLAS